MAADITCKKTNTAAGALVTQTVMTQAEIENLLAEKGAILSGHFVLTSGRHSDTYVQCARILEDPELTMRLARTAAAKVVGHKVDLVAAPAVGAILFGFAVAQALGVKFIFSEREAGKMTFRRSFEVPHGSKVLIAEDVVTTGGSVAEIAELIRKSGGEPVGVVSLIDRGGKKTFSEPYWPLLQLDVESWDSDSCVLCRSGEPFTSPGSRRITS